MKNKEKSYLTTRQAAQILGVNLHTVQNWVEKGSLTAWKTLGGHRRISKISVDTMVDMQKSQMLQTTTKSEIARLKILIVEDEAELREVYQLHIESWEFPVELFLASNGMEGLLKVGEIKPDLIISDLIMPYMDGFKMLNAIVENDANQSMGIIVVTTMEQGEIDQQGGLPENVTVLKKPIPFSKLKERILFALQNRH
jgi:excisionase family DNA binding protein